MKKIILIAFFAFSINAMAQTKISCTEEKKDSILTRTCVYKNTKIVETCDLVGKDTVPTSCSSAFFMKKGKKYITVDNCDIFNEKQDSLLIIVNQKIKESYLDKSQTKGGRICFANNPLKEYAMKQFEISFFEDKVIFNAYFGLSESCKFFNKVEMIFTVAEISKYLK